MRGPVLRILLPLTLIVAGIAAAPAEATLLVRSDGAGLLIEDKNNLGDFVFLTYRSDLDRYEVGNFSSFDVFKFDVQTGCSQSDSDRVRCVRNGGTMNIQLAGGNDTLDTTGMVPSGQESVAGNTGDDEITGHIGKDNLNGGSGDDVLRGIGGNDSLSGRAGSDRLEGGPGNDTLTGANLGDPGFDAMIGGRGRDVLTGRGGNDFFDSKEPVGHDAEKDTVVCGSGHDRVEADLPDEFPVPSACEEKDISPVGETPNVNLPAKSLRIARSGRAKARLRCPRGVHGLGCKGRLQLKVRGSSTRKVRYRIKAGRRKSVTLRLPAKAVRTLCRRQRRGKTTRGVLTSVEKGRLGRKTTVREPKLRLR